MNDAIDELLEQNARYAEGFDKGDLTAAPRRGLAVVTCMDARIRTHMMLGVTEGDIHVIRNAGGVVTDDAIRSLAVSQRKLGTTGVMVIQHTHCGMMGLDEQAFAEDVQRDTGRALSFAVGAFEDLEESVRASVARLRESDYLLHRDAVRGFVYDVESGRLREVT